LCGAEWRGARLNDRGGFSISSYRSASCNRPAEETGFSAAWWKEICLDRLIALSSLSEKNSVTEENWQRLRNLSLFKLWVTDRQLRRWWPLAALIAVFLLLVALLGRLVTS
jgi:hypothetical protein